MNSTDVVTAIYELKNPAQASNLSWFFKTGPGQYGEGDLFLGLKVPETRAISKRFRDLALVEVWQLLESDFHEVRQCGLFILVLQFQKSKSEAERKRIFDFYMKALDAGHVNNWDLVDATAPYLGDYLVNRPESEDLLVKLAQHRDLWHRRAAIILTFAHQKRGDLYTTLEIAELLIEDGHDLIHKAVGWTLREVGKKDIGLLRKFLEEYGKKLPRTALRYAIEKMTEAERKKWLEVTK